jgi:hypothetical protein
MSIPNIVSLCDGIVTAYGIVTIILMRRVDELFDLDRGSTCREEERMTGSEKGQPLDGT